MKNKTNYEKDLDIFVEKLFMDEIQILINVGQPNRLVQIDRESAQKTLKFQMFHLEMTLKRFFRDLFKIKL